MFFSISLIQREMCIAEKYQRIIAVFFLCKCCSKSTARNTQHS
uniref:Macaca fascicularis brain cDNA, clone: QmoA-11406 n=1 Tax=Macaca fascicularis TaxID=9541 RepID=I7G8G4_MACFA|nr:unnamed protein product [Macaca fascicularis]